MARRIIERIREKVQLGQYDVTAHAMEEMAEDNLDILDVEQAILNGQIVRTDKGDPRGTKYVIEGTAVNPKNTGWSRWTVYRYWRYLIITVYEITD
jgi:hypothetical protein